MPNIKSSMIASCEYNPTAQELEIQFKNGGTYVYSGISLQTYNAFLNAPSQGKFFQQYIKDKYPTTKLR